MTTILGISAFYHDSAACLVVDGEIVAAAQEERFTRKKHDPAFPVRAIEYCLQVPANRWGHGQFTAAQLKISQEVITILVFLGFSWLYLGETPRWNESLAFGLVLAAVVVATLPAR